MTGFSAYTAPRSTRPWELKARSGMERALLVSVSASALLLAAAPAMAQSTWTGATNTDFATGTNWSTTPVAPAAGDTAIVNNGALANQPVVGASTTVNNLQVSAGTIGVNAAQVLTVTTLLELSGTGTLNGPGTFSAGNVTISGGTVAAGAIVNTVGAHSLTGGQLDGTLGGGGNFNVTGGTVTQGATGVLAGAGQLNVTGGAITLAGANTYTGGTVLNGGNVTIAGAGTLGNVANTTTIQNAASTLDLGGTTQTQASLTMSAGAIANGTMDVTNSTLSGGTVNANATINATGAHGLSGVTVNGTLGGGGNFNQTAGTTTIGGTNSLTGAGALNATGGTINIANAQNFAGGTTIDTGAVVNIGNGSALGAGNINLNAGTLGATATITLANTITTAAGAGPRTIDTGANTLTLSGTLTGANTFTKTGAGTLTFGAGLNTAGYTGGMTLAAGTLSLQGNLAAGFGTITTTGSVIDYANGVNSAAPININSNATQLQVLAGTATQSGVISETAGPRPLEKIGAGTLVLTGANTYTGVTTITAGALNAQNNAALGTGNVVVTAGAALQVQGGVTLANTITLNGTGVANDGAIRNISGVNTLNGLITLGSASRINADANILFLAGGITGAGQNLTFGGAAGTTVVSGAISTGTGTLTKDGGNNLALDGNNTYTGVTTINAGVLQVNNGNAIADTGAVVVNGATATFLLAASETIGSLAGVAGAAVTLNANTLTTGGDNTSTTYAGNISGAGGSLIKNGTGNFTLSGTNTHTGTTTVNAGTLTLQGGAAIADAGAVVVNGGALVVDTAETIGSLAGVAGTTVTLNATLTTGGDNTSTTYAGNISGAGGLTKAGAGNFTLSGTNTHTGATTVNAGTLTLSGGNAIADTGAVVVNAGTLVVNAAETIGSLAGAAGSTVTLNGTLTTGGDNTSTAYAGVIAGASGLTKVGSGTFTLSGANTYTGTTNVNAGTLTTTGTIAGGLVAAAGSAVNAAGTINGGVTNAGAFSVTALLSNGGAAFINNNPGTLSVGPAVTFNNISTLTNNSASANAVRINAGATLTALTSVANNAGTLTNLGTLTAPTISNAAGATLTSTGTINAATAFNNAGTANAAGSLFGPINNNAGGIFNVTGNLAGNNVFTNAGTVNLTGGNLTGLTAFNNAGTLGVTGTRTLGATAFANQATGIVALQNGATTDNLTIGGTFAGTAGSRVSYDVNLAAGAQAADRVTVTGAASGATTLTFTAVNAQREVLAAPLNVFVGGAGSTLAVNTGVVASLSGGFVDYFLQESLPGSGTFQLVSAVNTGPIAAVSTSLSSTVTALSTGFHQPASAIVSRPDRPSSFTLFGDQRPGARDQVVPPPSGARDPVTRVQTPVTSAATGCSPNQLMGGPFVRIAAGDSKIDASGRGDRVGGGFPLSGNSRTNTDFSGIQGGVDAGICNIRGSGWNVHFGVMGGFVRATAKSNASGAGIANVNTTAKVDAPFIGLYTFVTSGPLTAEVSVRRDFYDARVTTPNPAVGGFFVSPNTKVKGDGTSFNTSLAYRVALGEQFYVEPQVGFSFGQTDFGRLPFATGANDVMNFKATESLLGRIGANFGAVFAVTDTLIVAPFGHISIWREMGKGSKTQTTLGSIGGQVFDFKTQRVGTFGQAGAGLQFKLDGTPFLGFVRGDLRFGSRIEAKAVNVGVRAQF